MTTALLNPMTTTPATTHEVAPAVRVSDLSVCFNDRAILDQISFDISAGDYVALLGPNGAGKTTLLSILATLTAPSEGRVELFGHATSTGAAVRSRLGMVGHQPMLYRDLTARENLVFYARLYGLAAPAARAAELLDAMHLADRGGDLVRTFSRGMVQRLSIARAMVHRPALLLADEPFAGLDRASAAALEEIFSGLHASGVTLVIVDHDLAGSVKRSERVIVLRQGHIALDRSTAGLDPRVVEEEVCRP